MSAYTFVTACRYRYSFFLEIFKKGYTKKRRGRYHLSDAGKDIQK